MTSAGDGRGHRGLEHTADEILTAWGPTREACLEEAVSGLVALFVDADGAGWGWHLAVEFAGGDEDVLVGLLEEVIFRLDVDSAIPVRVHVAPRPGGVVAHLWMVDRGRVLEVGATPKGVSRSGLTFGLAADGSWRCEVVIDV